MIKRVLYKLAGAILAGVMFITPVCAATPSIDPRFNATYYADTYPDLKAAYGYDVQKLWEHYVTYGQREKRKCYAGDTGGTILATTTMSATTSVAPVTTGYETVKLKDATQAQYNAVMCSLVNAYRAEHGVKALTVSDNCISVANLRASELLTKFDHIRPNGQKPGTAFTQLGIKFTKAGENLEKRTWSYDSQIGLTGDTDLQTYTKNVIDAYKASASHNACMLNPEWSKMGTSYSNDGTHNFNVQIFMK